MVGLRTFETNFYDIYDNNILIFVYFFYWTVECIFVLWSVHCWLFILSSIKCDQL